MAEAAASLLNGRSGSVKLGVFSGSARRRFGTGLMYLVVFEASLFGSGQMLHIGAVTVRMILFGISMFYLLISFFWGERIERETILLLASGVFVVSVGFCLGLIYREKQEIVIGDVTPLVYFFMLPFFELTIRGVRRVRAVVRVILASALIMTAGYVLVLATLWGGLISPLELYRYVTTVGRGDFLFSPGSWRIFYKGDLYLGIAVILFAFGKGRWSKMGLLLSFVALLLTGTRGFLLALFLVVLLYALVRPGSGGKRVIYSVALLICGTVALGAAFNALGNRSQSDRVRIITIQQVENRVTPLSLFLGHGFGAGVPERPDHMEIAYLEVFQKQGLVGLMWYAFLFLMFVTRFRRVARGDNRELAYGLFFSALFVFLESLTNPFINNPIGMSAILICLAGLKALAPGVEDVDQAMEVLYA